jgi:hypothetical protein
LSPNVLYYCWPFFERNPTDKLMLGGTNKRLNDKHIIQVGNIFSFDGSHDHGLTQR